MYRPGLTNHYTTSIEDIMNALIEGCREKYLSGANGISKIPSPVTRKVIGTSSKPETKPAKEYRLNKNSDKGRAIREAEKLADNSSPIIAGVLSRIRCKILQKKLRFSSSLPFFASSRANSFSGWMRHLLMIKDTLGTPDEFLKVSCGRYMPEMQIDQKNGTDVKKV